MKTASRTELQQDETTHGNLHRQAGQFNLLGMRLQTTCTGVCARMTADSNVENVMCGDEILNVD